MKEGIKGIKESLTLRASHPRNLTLLLNLGLTPKVSHKESSIQAFQDKIIDFLLFFEERYIFLHWRMENEKSLLRKPKDKKGKGCHDLSKRWEAMPRSPLTLRSLAMISLGFRTAS